MRQKNKSTCYCCGYKTLLRGDMSEACPICLWKDDFFYLTDIFEVSSYNNMTLYQAQRNYDTLGVCKPKYFSRCRKPLESEVRDKEWLSIQERIESKYSDVSVIIEEIAIICENLKKSNAKMLYYDFKVLRDIEDADEEPTLLYRNGLRESSEAKSRLLLISLSIALIKIDLNCLTSQIIKYYEKDLAYYISWSIMLSIWIDMRNKKTDLAVVTELLIDIENNNFYGLKSLEKKVNKYWYSKS